MTLTAPLQGLLARLDKARVEATTVEASAFEVVYVLTLPDGQPRRHHLRVEAYTTGTGVSVREAGEARLLPRTCPERHINGDGTFCLGLPGVDEPDLSTPAGADKWWARLAGYLSLQALSEATGKWPSQHAWPHGLAAADLQHVLETLYGAAPWLQALIDRGPIPVAANGRVERRRAPCPCGSGAQTRHCHEGLLVRTHVAQRLVADFEAEFYRATTHPCCETMTSCGVRDEWKRRNAC